MRRIATLPALLLFAATAFASEDVIKKGFTVGDGGTLRLDGSVGSLRIVTGGTGVAFEITRKADDRQAEKMMQGHRITFEQSGNDVIVKSELDRNGSGLFHWNTGDYEVQWNIRVPDRYNLDVETSGGSIHIDEIEGTVEARTSGGSIRTGRLDGEGTLKTSGGSITVEGATAKLVAHTSGGSISVGDTTGPVEVKTSGGSIKIARTGGEVVARTSGGGIRIEDAMGRIDAKTSGGSIHATLSRQPAADSSLATSGGSVIVSLAPSVAVELDARASGGGVHSDVPVTVQGVIEEDSLRGQINGGGPKLTLRTSGGGIRVKGM